MSKNKNTKTCKTLFYIGGGEEEFCGKPAVALVDAGTEHEFAVCQDCIKDCHHTRITYVKRESLCNP